MIRTPAAIIRDWWSDPAYRDTVITSAAITVFSASVLLALILAGGR